MSDTLNARLTGLEGMLLHHLDGTVKFLALLFVIGAICIAIEKIHPVKKDAKTFNKDFRKELGLALLNMIVFIPIFVVVISSTILVILNEIAPPQMFDKTLTALPLGVQIILGLLLIDLGTYWRHRFTHNHMWPYHSFHHSAEEISWITSLRLHPVDQFMALVFDTVFLYFLGFSGTGIAVANIIMMAYNYFTHLNLNIVFSKPVRYIFASPHYHRWHHATDKSAYDKNFCSMFSLLDVIFGTYYHPETLPEAYGLSPREQKAVPEKLIPHILQPIKKDLKKILRKKT